MKVDELETPVVVVDIDRLQANITRLQTYLAAHGITNRPHSKTHKIPAIARMQIAAGAAGITCQKLGEAEVMAAAGISDILVPYNIIGRSKLERLMELARQIHIRVTADSHVVVAGLAAAAREAGVLLPVLVECDTGLARCGVQTPEAAAALARVIASSKGLHFGGLMTYPNNERLDPFVQATRALLAPDGLAIECVSGGGTQCMWQAHTHRELTEHRAGEYIFGDRHALATGAMSLPDIAFTIHATVVSRPTRDRMILDAGSKTLSSDRLADQGGHGLLLEYREARIYELSEEHAHVDCSGCARRPAIGERVTIIPNHCCVVTNLFNELIGVRDGIVVNRWPVAARGRLQ